MPEPVALPAAAAELIRRASLPGAALETYVEQLIQDGAAPEWVCHELIPLAARRLGHQWEEDSSSFVDVTVVVCRLEQLVARLHHELAPPVADGRWVGRALVGAVPGEQHTLGVTLVAEALRVDGWDVVLTPVDARQVLLVQMVSQEWFDVAALSATSERNLMRVPTLIRALRRGSRNASLGVLLGGRPFSEQHELAESCGADGTASDAQRAVALARCFCQSRDSRTALSDVQG